MRFYILWSLRNWVIVPLDYCIIRSSVYRLHKLRFFGFPDWSFLFFQLDKLKFLGSLSGKPEFISYSVQQSEVPRFHYFKYQSLRVSSGINPHLWGGGIAVVYTIGISCKARSISLFIARATPLNTHYLPASSS